MSYLRFHCFVPEFHLLFLSIFIPNSIPHILPNILYDLDLVLDLGSFVCTQYRNLIP